MIKYLFIAFVTVFMININNSYADEQDLVDLLIENKTNQENVEMKISDLEKEIKEIKDKEYDSNIVTVSFIQGDINYEYIDNEESNKKQYVETKESKLSKLKSDLNELEENEEELHKKIEEDTEKYLNENNQDLVDIYWPLKDYTQVSSHFGYRIHPITKKADGHRGTDIPAPEGTEVLSANDGVVIFSDYQGGYGNVVKIKHFDGTITVYAHNSKNIVNTGDIVTGGQVVAEVGSTGNSTGNHVHFEVIYNEENINPIDVVRFYE